MNLLQPSTAIDWITLTYVGNEKIWGAVDNFFPKLVARYVVGLKKKRSFGASPNGRNGFKNHRYLDLGGEAASISWGGNEMRGQIELRGAFCSRVDFAFWRLLGWFCRRYQARITRLDIAADFFRGEVDMAELKTLYQSSPEQVLNIRGPVPTFGEVDLGQGRTWYFGSPGSVRRVRVYEKGMQLQGELRDKIQAKIDAGKATYDEVGYVEKLQNPRDWVRVELTLKRDRRVYEIPYDLICPLGEDREAEQARIWWGYICGLGPYFRNICPEVEAQAVKYRQKQFHLSMIAELTKQALHVRTCYGSFFGTVYKCLPDPTWFPVLFCNLDQPWKRLEKYAGWELDEDLREQVYMALMSMIPPEYIETFFHRLKEQA